MSHLGQGRTARAVGVPLGVEAASLLARKERLHWGLPSLSSCCCFSPAFPFPQTSRELFKASGAGGPKWSKEKKGMLVCLPCSGSCKNLQGKEYSPVENSFQCVCEIGRMAAPWGALFHGASTSLCARLCNLQHNPLLQSPLTQVSVLAFLCWECGIQWFPCPCCCFLGTECNLIRDRLTNCKVLWLQEFATKRFLVSVLVKIGYGLDIPYLSMPPFLRYETEISMRLIAFAVQGRRRVESQELEITELLRFPWVIHSSTANQYVAL